VTGWRAPEASRTTCGLNLAFVFGSNISIRDELPGLTTSKA
jgi:hypothetical protein